MTGARFWGGIWQPGIRIRSTAPSSSTARTLRPCGITPTLSHPGQMLKSWYIGLFQVPWPPERLLSASDFAWLRRALIRTSQPGAFQADDLERYREAWVQPGVLTAIL